jgi:hypothetical protein
MHHVVLTRVALAVAGAPEKNAQSLRVVSQVHEREKPNSIRVLLYPVGHR